MEIGLTLTAGSQAANVSLNVDVHSELMSAYPWGSTKPDQTTFNMPDKAAFNGKQLVFTDTAGLACTLHVGATLPTGATVHQVTLNG